MSRNPVHSELAGAAIRRSAAGGQSVEKLEDEYGGSRLTIEGQLHGRGGRKPAADDAAVRRGLDVREGGGTVLQAARAAGVSERTWRNIEHGRAQGYSHLNVPRSTRGPGAPAGRGKGGDGPFGWDAVAALSDRLAGTARRLGVPSERADDVVQDAIVRAYRAHPGGFRDEAQAVTYLTAALRSAMAEHSRQRRGWRPLDRSDENPDNPGWLGL